MFDAMQECVMCDVQCMKSKCLNALTGNVFDPVEGIRGPEPGKCFHRRGRGMGKGAILMVRIIMKLMTVAMMMMTM